MSAPPSRPRAIARGAVTHGGRGNTPQQRGIFRHSTRRVNRQRAAPRAGRQHDLQHPRQRLVERHRLARQARPIARPRCPDAMMKCSKMRPMRPTSVAQRSSVSRANRRAKSGRPRSKSARQKYHWSNATQKKQRASPESSTAMTTPPTDIPIFSSANRSFPTLPDYLSLTAPCATDIPINGGTLIAPSCNGLTEYSTTRRLLLQGATTSGSPSAATTPTTSTFKETRRSSSRATTSGKPTISAPSSRPSYTPSANAWASSLTPDRPPGVAGRLLRPHTGRRDPFSYDLGTPSGCSPSSPP